jgi:F0F1-type ATP synthase assembly protein I
MAMIGTVLSGLASLAMLVFGIQILIAAFKTSAGWGLASLLLPFAVFVFVAKHWEQTRTPFLRSLIAFAIVLVGTGLSVYGAISSAPIQ